MSETSSNASSLADLPYAQRQFIQFETAETLQALQEQGTSEELGHKIVNALDNPVALLLPAPIWSGIKALKKAQSQKSKKAYELSKQLKNFYELGIETIPIPIQQVSFLSLPPGHPQTGVLYVAHPSDPATYLPAADFHRLTFEHKFAEAIRLLMHLGARTISVTHTRGWDHEFAGKLSAGIPQVGVGASAEASIESESSTRLLYEAELTGHNDPQLPDDLVWYPHEPTWQSAAEARLEFGLQRFSLKLQYTDDYGVNADLAVDARNVGFSLGGSFEKHQKTVWSLEGTFGG